MRAGKLKHIIDIERKVQLGVNALNEPNFTWQTWRSPYASLDVMRGKETFDAATSQRYQQTFHRFTVRFDEVIGLDPTMRLKHDGQYFDISRIQPDAQEREDCIIECTLQDGYVESTILAIAVTGAIPDGTAGVVYGGFTVSATGGSSPYVFTLASGALPTGLTLDPDTGAVAGTPTTPGTYTCVIKVTDAAGNVSRLPSLTITIA